MEIEDDENFRTWSLGQYLYRLAQPSSALRNVGESLLERI
jgi:hypothetical protein